MKNKSTNYSYFYISLIFKKASVILVSTNAYKSILDMLSIYAILKLSIKMGFVFINLIPQLCVVNLKLLFLWANTMSVFENGKMDKNWERKQSFKEQFEKLVYLYHKKYKNDLYINVRLRILKNWYSLFHRKNHNNIFNDAK